MIDELLRIDVRYKRKDFFSDMMSSKYRFPLANCIKPTIFSFFILATVAFATTINVPTDSLTIQAGINGVTDGDTVKVAPGTYLETINFNGKKIVVISSHGADTTIIDGNQGGSVVTFENDENATAVLKGFTIQNGSNSGIRCWFASPSLANLIIKNNSSTNGGGVYCRDSSPNMENLLIIGNSSTDNGGGLYAWNDSYPILKNVTISGNSSATNGGGIYCNLRSAPQIINTIVAYNTGNYGIYVNENEAIDPSVSYSNFYDNENGNCYNCGSSIGVDVTTNTNVDSCDTYYNIQKRPYFNSINNSDYTLENWSYCIGAGTASGAPNTDLDGNSRIQPQGSNPDMGVYENPFATPQYHPRLLNVPTSYTTIQSALDSANATDTVLVQSGTYIENIIWPDSNGIQLLSAGDSSNTIINGSGAGSVIYMNPETAIIDTTTLIRGFRITNGGNVTNGGGFYIKSGDPKIISCVIHNNNATSKGGGFYIYNSEAVLANLVISANSSDYDAGGVSIYGNSHIRNVTIMNCSANYRGGGIGIWSGSPTIKNIVIKNNTASTGGALWSIGSPSISNTRIFNNVSSEDAGGMSISDGSFNNMKITGNSAIANGGGINVSGNASISNVIIADNTAGDKGGGMYFSYGGDPTLTNSSIIGNISDMGSAIYVGDYSSGDGVNGEHLTIFNNSGELGAIYISSLTGIGTISSSNILSNNTGVYNNDSSGVVVAQTNYWGHLSGPYHPSENASGQGDSVNAFVNITPWLTDPSTDAPPIPVQNLTVTGKGDDFISLKWDTSLLGNLAGYKLYYNSDSSGYPYTNSVVVGSDTAYTLSGLTIGTTYYLAMTTYNTDGNESWYSTEATGNTRVIQVQNLDIGGAEDLEHIVSHIPTITFDYYDNINGIQTNYFVQVSTDSTFSSANMWDSGSNSSSATSIAYNGNTLLDGSTYHLRVRAASNDFWSDWSALTFRMNTAPTTPVQISPVTNEIADIPVLLKVLNSTDTEIDTLTYSFAVYSDSNLTTKLDSVNSVAEGIDTTTWQVTGTLPDNGQYWWTISANDGHEESVVSYAASFILNLDNNVPYTFNLIAPLEGLEIQALTPLFQWQPAYDPDPFDTVRYTINLDTPEPGVVSIDVDTATSYLITDTLLDNTQYHWRIVANDIFGFQRINEGSYHTFITNIANDPPSTVILVTPTENSIEVDLSPLFYWTEAVDPDPIDTVSYHLFIDLDQEFTSTVAIPVDSNAFNYDTLNAVLLDNTEYYWKINALDNHGSETGSETLQFWTDAFPEPPLNFATVSPANNVEGLAIEVEFVWEETNDPDPLEEIVYRVIYATDWEDSSTFVYSETIQDTSMVIPLADNNQYYWLVEALDLDGFVVGSNENTPNVIVVGILGIEDDLIPVEFAIHQNYPNPFNPITTLRYDLPEQTHVNITVYDMLGRKVMTILNEQQDPGYKSLIWDATNNYGKSVSAGIYLYRVQAGEYMQTKKMVLLK